MSYEDFFASADYIRVQVEHGELFARGDVVACQGLALFGVICLRITSTQAKDGSWNRMRTYLTYTSEAVR